MVDDEVDYLNVLGNRLARRGIEVVKASNGAEGIQTLRKQEFDVALLDLKMRDMDGIEVLKIFKKMDPDLRVIMLTGQGKIETAVSAMKKGAADFLEKPADPPGTPEDPDVTLASMGIYVFRWDFLRELLIEDAQRAGSKRDFGGDIIPHIVKHGKAVAHRFDTSCVRHKPDAPAYWRDVGTVDAYWKANISLTEFTPDLDLWDKNWPIWTYSESVPPAKFIHDEEERRGSAVSSLVAGGCIVSGTNIRNSLLFTQVHTNSYSVLEHVVALPYVNVARSARLRKCVIDRGVQIPKGLIVGEDPEEELEAAGVDDAVEDGVEGGELVGPVCGKKFEY